MHISHNVFDTVSLTFDDVLLLPGYTQIQRDEVDVSTYLTGKIKLRIPLISSPMDTVTTAKMAIALGRVGGLGVIHRNLSIAAQAADVEKVKRADVLTAAAVGVGKDLEARVEALAKVGIDVIVIDSGHGFSKWVVEATRFIVGKHKHIAVIAGNVATAEGAKALIEAGAHALRVGMGPGSICTTRVVAGIGVPQMSAILETATAAKNYGIPVIADGGLRSSGDIVKALAAGASTVMSGSLFSGCREAPGKLITRNGRRYKYYRGMGSIAAMQEGSAARYGQEYRKGQKKTLIAEGIEGLVPYRGTVAQVVEELVGGLVSGMYYTGAATIAQLQKKAQFVRITPASVVENAPHDILPYDHHH